MKPKNFTAKEWKLIVNAPHLIHHALITAERGTIFARRKEAKALDAFLSDHKTRSAMVKAIMDGQKDADDEIEASLEVAKKRLRRVGALLENKADADEAEAVRDFLMGAGEAIAEAAREGKRRGGTPISDTEKQSLTMIRRALKATPADKRRRREAAEAEKAEKRAQAEQARKERQAEARKRTEEMRKRREAEAQKPEAVEEAQKKVADEARKKAADEARKKREAEAQKKAKELHRKRELQAKKAEEAKARREAEAMRREAEAMKREAEATMREAEAMKREAEAAKEERIYVVKPGDTLSGIAKSVYGKAGRWREIFEANKDIIENPNLIRPGWKLRIPD
jgi:nucleoid-associated protein YgaU